MDCGTVADSFRSMELQRRHLQALVNLNTGVYAFQAVTFGIILLIGVYIRLYLREPRRCHCGIDRFGGNYIPLVNPPVENDQAIVNLFTRPPTYNEAVRLNSDSQNRETAQPAGVEYPRSTLC